MVFLEIREKDSPDLEDGEGLLVVDDDMTLSEFSIRRKIIEASEIIDENMEAKEEDERK